MDVVVRGEGLPRLKRLGSSHVQVPLEYPAPGCRPAPGHRFPVGAFLASLQDALTSFSDVREMLA